MSDSDPHLGTDPAPNFRQQIDREGGGITRAWWFWPAIVAMIYFAAHMITATRYGYFVDELYYLACSHHLDWGYVDQPPLIALVTWFETHVFGTSLSAIRLLPAVAGTCEVALTALIAREFGGGSFAQALAALGVLL